MVTGAIKNKVDKIWTDIWAGGITNPLTVIEQLTYLMFIRSLDEKELATEDFENMAGEKMEHIFPASEAGQSMRWSRFKDKDSREIFLTMQQRVFPAIKKMKYGRLPDFDANGELVEIEDDPTRPDEGNTAFARYMDDAMFLIPTPQVLQKIITGLEDLYTHDIADLDMQGDLYEYMLGKLATAGQNGQFRTPKHIRDMMVELVQPTPDDFICDPACGTAGFLVSSAQYLRTHYEDSMTPEQWQHFAGPMFTGFDTDRTMLRISAMNLMLHSITNPEIDYKDSVSKQNPICSKYTVCLANPPFKGTVDAESINDDLKAVTNTKKTELLFLALFLRMLKTGGRCACIVPDGVLFGSSKAHQSIRKELIENHQLRAVISMPSGVFKPYAGVSTAVLVFTKTGAGGTDKVWFYDMKADGLSLDDKRTEVKENDIPDIISEQNLQAIPLMVEAGGEHQCVGVLYLERREGTQQETDHLLFELVARYVSIVVFNAVVKLATQYRDIESAHEETRRASWEDSMLHVQNMVLDNCLSTIKHETIYYPNKIKQIIGRLNTQNLPEKDEREAVETITELIEYYKGIFTILSSCAARQLEEVTFRRNTIPVQELFDAAGKYFRKVTKNRTEKVELIIEPMDAKVIGDVNQLRFLFENLIDEALAVREEGVIRLQARKDNEYIRFLFTDTRREKSVTELNQLFYPNLARMTSGEKGELRGTEYLICKQIIRDHDEFAGRRGCRINAEPAEGGGFTVYFTIPRR